MEETKEEIKKDVGEVKYNTKAIQEIKEPKNWFERTFGTAEERRRRRMERDRKRAEEFRARRIMEKQKTKLEIERLKREERRLRLEERRAKLGRHKQKRTQRSVENIFGASGGFAYVPQKTKQQIPFYGLEKEKKKKKSKERDLFDLGW